MTVTCSVTQDGGLLRADLAGPLDGHGVAALRRSLLKCLAEQPDALIIDVSRLRVLDPVAMTVFVAVARQATSWPGTPVMLCAPTPHTRTLLGRAAFRQLPVFVDAAAARSDARHHRVTLPSLRDELLPVTGAARQARNMATDACLRWELPDLIGPASTVMGELVTNAVVHAATVLTARLSLTDRYLHIAVRDGSVAVPRLHVGSTAAPTTGRGLRLVEAVTTSWGSLPADGGKVVWASLAVDPGGAAR
jgi:anti-anti-sigma regulatory factor